MPSQADEQQSAARAQLLWDVMTTRAGQAVPMPQLRPGLLGLPGPGEVVQYWQQLQAALGAAAPRLQTVLEKSGAQELVADVQWGLLQRFAARGIKFVSGLADGGSSGAASSSAGSITASSKGRGGDRGAPAAAAVLGVQQP